MMLCKKHMIIKAMMTKFTSFNMLNVKNYSFFLVYNSNMRIVLCMTVVYNLNMYTLTINNGN